ncbi:Calx-beta domain-containing protein, partial [Sediminicola arcticus]
MNLLNRVMILKKVYSFLTSSLNGNILKRALLVGAFLILGFQGFGQLPSVTIAQNGNGFETGPLSSSFTVTVASGAGTDGIVDVNYSVLGSSTATSGSDYTALSGTVTVVYTTTSGGSSNIAVDVLDDVLVEGDETVIVELTADAAYDLGTPNTATVTITDNDSYTASISATVATATEAGTTAGEFTVDLGTVNTTGSAIVVNYAISTGGSNATNTTDYTTLGTSVSIADGQQTNTIPVTPVDDALVEGNETVILTLASGTGYALGTPNTATVTITDNDSYTA